MPITSADLDWKLAVIDVPEEPQAELKRIAESRAPLASMMADVALKVGGHSVIAKMFHAIWPDNFGYLGQGTCVGWFEFTAPRWHHIGQNNEVFLQYPER